MQTTEQPLELVAITKKEQLQDDTAALIIEKFMPFQAQIDEWKAKAESLVVTDISQTEDMEEARKARLALRKVRTGADKVREELKAESLRYGRAVQGIFNLIEAGIKPIEEHLERQEKFKELYEAKQKAELRLAREQQAAPYREYMFANIDLGEITQEDFDRMLRMAKIEKEEADAAAAKAEEDKKAREKAEAEEREALRIENDKLKKEQAERDSVNAIRWQELSPYNAFGEPCDPTTLWKLTEQEFDLMLAEKIHAYEMKKQQNIKEAADKKAAEEKAKLDRKEKERLQKELDDKKAAEEKAEADRLAAIEADLSKGDKEKFADMINDLDAIKAKYQFKSKKYKTVHAAVSELINKTIVYAQQKTS